MHVDVFGNPWPSERAARAAAAMGEREQTRRRAAMSGPAFTVSAPEPEPLPAAGMTAAERAAMAGAVLIVDAIAAAMDARNGAAA